MRLFESAGLKRKIANVLSVVLGVSMLVPGAQGVPVLVAQIAAFFGVSGLVHATAVGTLHRSVLLSCATFLTVLASLSWVIPGLDSYAKELTELSALLSAYALRQHNEKHPA